MYKKIKSAFSKSSLSEKIELVRLPFHQHTHILCLTHRHTYKNKLVMSGYFIKASLHPSLNDRKLLFAEFVNAAFPPRSPFVSHASTEYCRNLQILNDKCVEVCLVLNHSFLRLATRYSNSQSWTGIFILGRSYYFSSKTVLDYDLLLLGNVPRGFFLSKSLFFLPYVIDVAILNGEHEQNNECIPLLQLLCSLLNLSFY